MDQQVIEALDRAGVDCSFEKVFPVIAIGISENGVPRAIENEILVVAGERKETVRLQRFSDAWRSPQSVSRTATPAGITCAR